MAKCLVSWVVGDHAGYPAWPAGHPLLRRMQQIGWGRYAKYLTYFAR
jgi:hypothetical protein